MNDKIRAKFDAWALANPHLTRATLFDSWRGVFETVVIELPPVPAEPEPPEDAIDDSYLDAYHAAKRMRDDCVKAIEAAGLKVAP